MATALAYKTDAIVKPLRDAKGRLLPGSPTMNPKGRPPTGLAWAEWTREIAAETNPHARGTLAQEVIRSCFEIAMGLPIPRDKEYLRKRAAAFAAGEQPPAYEGEFVTPTLAEQMRAQELIRGWGFRAPPQELEVTANGTTTQSVIMPKDELEKLERELAAAVSADRSQGSDQG